MGIPLHHRKLGKTLFESIGVFFIKNWFLAIVSKKWDFLKKLDVSVWRPVYKS
jgi:hypothetical protein